jgi:hypothetical protein
MNESGMLSDVIEVENRRPHTVGKVFEVDIVDQCLWAIARPLLSPFSPPEHQSPLLAPVKPPYTFLLEVVL